MRRTPLPVALLLLLAAAVQLRVVPVPAWVDSISLGMAVLSIGCLVATWRAMPDDRPAERWRWQAASAGWFLWTAHWIGNALLDEILNADQLVPSMLIALWRVAFILALTPLAGPREPRPIRWMDGVLGAIFATLLALLSLPEIVKGAMGDLDYLYLYVGYVVMAMLAGMSLATQKSRSLRDLSLALLVAFAVYALAAIALRQAYDSGRIDYESRWFLAGDVAFVTYLLILPRRWRRDEAVEPATPGPAKTAAGLVSLLLAVLIVIIAFAFVQDRPAIGVTAGTGAFLAYAARAMLSEAHQRRLQERAIAVERDRSRTMIDFMHEIRSPLGVVSLNASLLRRTDTLTDKQAAICSSIDASCVAVRRLLDDVLALERLEAGLVPPVIARHDLAAIAREVVMLLEARWREAGVRVVAPPGSVPAAIDQAAVHRILLNLVDNAVRFTPRDGTVTLSVAHEADRLVLSVADDGMGMDASQQARLFERFAMVGRPLHGRRGSGLGLSISLALARTMGGDIQVRSEPGRGTTMRLLLPRSGTRDYTRV